MLVGKRKRVGLYACNCAKCKTAKTKCFYSYSTVCRHRNMYGTSTAEDDREGCARMCEEDERSSRESQDVTFSGVFSNRISVVSCSPHSCTVYMYLSN